MLRPPPICQAAARHRRRTARVGSAASRLLSTEAARADDAIANDAPPKRRSSFLAEVDAIMERNAPRQYEQFLASRAAAEKWRAMRRRNEAARVQAGATGRSGALDGPAGRGGLAEDTRVVASVDEPPRFAKSSADAGDDVPWYKRQGDVSEYASSEAPSNEASGGNESKHTDDEIPWYKRRPDMSDFGAGRAPAKEVLPGEKNQPKPSPSGGTLPTSSEADTKKKGGVFASISQAAINFNRTDGKAGTSIPLAELFPTLYGAKQEAEESSAAPKRPANPAMEYDAIDFESYKEAMEAIFEDGKAFKHVQKFEAKSETNKRIVERVREWLLDDRRVVEKEGVRARWDKLDEAWRTAGMGGAALREKGDDKTESTFVAELRAQREVFLSKLLAMDGEASAVSNDGAAAAEPSDEEFEEELKSQFHHVAAQVMGVLGRYCARRARSAPMEVAWWKVKESGMVLPKDTISTYLYVVSTMGMADSIGLSGGMGTFPFTDPKIDSKGSDDGSDESEETFLIPEEIATYHDLTSKPTESSISLRVKALASKGEAKEAEELLEKFKEYLAADEKSDDLIRLRTYLPILKQYCDERDVSSALSLFKRMQTTEGVFLEPENYILLLATLAENKFFCDDSPPIEGATEIGYRHTHGPALFDEIATEMAGDVLEISSSSARRMYNALATGFKDFRGEDSDDDNAVVSALEEAHPLMSMPLTMDMAKENEVVASRVSLDRSTGICPTTGCQQRLIILEPDQRKQLHDDLLDLSIEQFTKFAGKRLEDSPESAREKLQAFSDWLDEREGEPFTAIIDGANVGYYMQSFDKGRFNYHQIKFMVDTLEERGEKPLVIIPYKYGWRQFYSTKREQQTLDDVEVNILKDLKESGKLYKVPPRCLDDFYWMLASVADQTASRKGRDLSVPSDDPDGRFPGTRPMLISNDQMRDHKLELLEPRLFRRWYGCHIVNYNFTAFVMGESVEGNEIGFSPADFFSREIQMNPCPIDESSEWSGRAWHFPVNDWGLDERFVVRIPSKKK